MLLFVLIIILQVIILLGRIQGQRIIEVIPIIVHHLLLVVPIRHLLEKKVKHTVFHRRVKVQVVDQPTKERRRAPVQKAQVVVSSDRHHHAVVPIRLVDLRHQVVVQTIQVEAEVVQVIPVEAEVRVAQVVVVPEVRADHRVVQHDHREVVEDSRFCYLF